MVDDAVTVTAMLASVVVILTAVWAAVRAGLRVRDEVRDNTAATRENTRMLTELLSVDGRLVHLETRVSLLEQGIPEARALDWGLARDALTREGRARVHGMSSR